MARKSADKPVAPAQPEAAQEPAKSIGRPRRDPNAEATEALQVYLPISLKRALAEEARKQNTSMAAIITDALRDKLGVKP